MAQTVLKLKTTDGKFYFTGALKGLYSSFKLMVEFCLINHKILMRGSQNATAASDYHY